MNDTYNQIRLIQSYRILNIIGLQCIKHPLDLEKELNSKISISSAKLKERDSIFHQ